MVIIKCVLLLFVQLENIFIEIRVRYLSTQQGWSQFYVLVQLRVTKKIIMAVRKYKKQFFILKFL